jgi:hypothetical protein
MDDYAQEAAAAPRRRGGRGWRAGHEGYFGEVARMKRYFRCGACGTVGAVEGDTSEDALPPGWMCRWSGGLGMALCCAACVERDARHLGSGR